MPSAVYRLTQRFGPVLYIYQLDTSATQAADYFFVVKGYLDGTAGGIDLEGDGNGHGEITFINGKKELNELLGRIMAGQYEVGTYPLFLDAGLYREQGVAVTGGFGKWLLWNLAYDFARNESVLRGSQNTPILSETMLGPGVTNSSLKTVGVLDSLEVGGHTQLTTVWADQYLNLPALPPANILPIILDQVNMRVGISNPLPDAVLDVFGDTNIYGWDTSKNALTVTGRTEVKGALWADTYLNLPPINPSDLFPITLDQVNMRVGISTALPDKTLDVFGDASIYGWDTSKNALTVTGRTEVKGSLWADTYENLPPTDVSPITLDKVNGRVGIGNGTPDHTLDVNGTFNVDGNSTLDMVSATEIHTGTVTATGVVTADSFEAQTTIQTPEIDVNGTAYTNQIRVQGELITTGNGDPDGAIPAPVGSLYMRKDGGDNTSLYSKMSGGATATGWKPVGAGGGGAMTYLTTTNSNPINLAAYPNVTNVGQLYLPVGTWFVTYTIKAVAGTNITTAAAYLFPRLGATPPPSTEFYRWDNTKGTEYRELGAGYDNNNNTCSYVITLTSPDYYTLWCTNGGNMPVIEANRCTLTAIQLNAGTGGGGGNLPVGTVLRAYNTTIFNPQQDVWLPIVSLSLPTSGLWRLHVGVLVWRQATQTASMLGESPPSNSTTDLSVGQIFMTMGGTNYDNATQCHTVYVQTTGANVYKIWSRGLSLQYGGNVYPGWAQICAEKVG